MLVIHPKDRTTEVLAMLYDGKGAQVVTDYPSRHLLKDQMYHLPKREWIMLLGHGCDRGLYFRENDEDKNFDKIIIDKSFNHQLRHHGSRLIGIWCHAVDFARQEGLHGLFSGMLISEKAEAEEYGIDATQEEILASNRMMFAKLRSLLDDEDVMWHEIPERMREWDEEHTALSEFNYGKFYYL